MQRLGQLANQAEEEEEMEEALFETLHHRFAVYQATETSTPCLAIKDYDTNTVSTVDDQAATIKLIVGREFPSIPLNLATRRMETFLYRRGEFLDIPQHSGFRLEGWAWSRPLRYPLAEEIMNIEDVQEPWCGCLKRLSDPEAFGAWIWGVASGEYRGRQILWIRGKGADGKSYMARCIADNLFHNGYEYIQGFSMSGEHARFTASRLENKCLVVLDDCKNPRLVSSELARTISGGKDGGLVSIERKGQNAYQSVLNCRMMALSNEYPTLSSTEADRSRLIFLEMSSLAEMERDATIGQAYREALPSFLSWARHAYSLRAHKNTVIMLNDKSKEWLDILSMDEAKYIEDFVRDNFEQRPNATLPMADLHARIAANKRTFDIANISHPATVVKNWLIENGWATNSSTGLKGIDVRIRQFIE